MQRMFEMFERRNSEALPSAKINLQQVDQLSQRDRAAGWVSYGKNERLELGDNIYGHYRSVFNHCGVIGQQSNQDRWENAK